MGSVAEEPSRVERWLLWVALPLIVAASALFKVRDPDVWWRIKTGEWIWTHQAIPTVDPFSYTADGPWNCVEPVANLLLYAAHQWFGATSLSWFGAWQAAVLGASLVALTQVAITGGPRLGPAAVAVGLAVGASNFRLGPKPEVFSLVGLALLLALLHVSEQKRERWLLAAVVPLLLGWGALHRGVTVGLAVVGAAALCWLLRRETRPLAGAALASGGLATVALALVPGIAGSLRSSASVVATAAYVEHLGEWEPLTLEVVWNTVPMLGLLAALWLLVAPVPRRCHFGTLVVLGTGLMALRHVRFVPLVAVALVPEVAWGLARAWRRHHEAVERHARPVLVQSLLVAAAVGAVTLPYVQRPVTTWGPGLHRFRRPVHAAQFLATHPPPGKMFNTFNYGSYLLYALAPAQKVFIDGRNDQVYRPEFFAQVSLSPAQPAVLEQLVEEYGVTYAVLECTTMITTSYQWLYQNPDWRLVFLDDQAAIMVKRTPESREYLERFAYHELRPDTALVRAHALARDPRPIPFANEVLRHVRESPDSIRAHYLAALVRHYRGEHEVARAEERRVRELAAARRVTVPAP